MKGNRVTAVIADADLKQGAVAPPPDQVTKALYGDDARPDLSVSRYSDSTEALTGRMTQLVKGAGFAGEGGNTPLTDQGDIGRRAFEATIDLRTSTRDGIYAKSSVVKSFSPDFLGRFGALRTALESPSIPELLGRIASPDVMRSFTAGNLGIGSSE